jgi:hypothetical protein
LFLNKKQTEASCAPRCSHKLAILPQQIPLLILRQSLSITT